MARNESRVRSLLRAIADPFGSRKLRQDISEMRALLEDLHQGSVALKRKLNALIRAQYLSDAEACGFPFHITRQRFQLRSQNEEDGLILATFKWIGVVHRSFVELGCGGNGGNSGALAYECGWRGLMVDRAPDNIEKITKLMNFNPEVKAVCQTVTPENVNAILTENGMAGEIDFFSLDIDSFDYWVLEAMTACRPRLMAVEYNNLLGPTAPLTVPRDADLRNAPKGYHGASLAAMEKLARRKGYRLLFCDEMGVNAFYLRQDIMPECPGVSPVKAFRMPKTTVPDLPDRLSGTGFRFVEV